MFHLCCEAGERQFICMRSNRAGLRGVSASGRVIGPVGYADAALSFEIQPTGVVPEPKLLTVPEAATILRISASSVRRLQQCRRIPFFKLGGSIRFARSDLLSYLARQRIDPVGQ
jgi:excisionase family DNA binding protein